MGEFLDSIAQDTANRQRLAEEGGGEGTFFDPMVGGGKASTAGTVIGATGVAGIGSIQQVVSGARSGSAGGVVAGVGSFLLMMGGGGLMNPALLGAISGGSGDLKGGANLLNIVTFGGMNRRAQDLFEAEAGQIQEVNRVNAMEQIARSREASAQAVAKLTSQSIL